MPAHALARMTDRPTALEPEVQARADLYGLLAALLRAVPTAELVGNLAGLAIDDGPDDFSRALLALRLAAREVPLPEIDDEYHALFIGLGRGELVPYGSWYLTGFLMEAPLGELRRDLERLGFGRQEGVCEPEDHIAALCEVMTMLVSDAGIRGVVLLNRARKVRFNPPTVWAESGANLGLVARQAALRGLSGLEWAAGIPGTVAGCVVMNAGTRLGEMKDSVKAVRIVTPSGE